MSFLFVLFIVFIIYIQIQKNVQNQNVSENTLKTLFKVQNFHDVQYNNSIPGITLICANSHGENYLFAKKNTMISFSIMDVNKIYEQAQKDHIHNIIILQSSTLLSNNILDKIKDYNIQIWDENKIYSLIYSPATHSVLSTSDTSDDKCKIDTNQFNPIQEPSSFWNNFFKKPDRL